MQNLDLNMKGYKSNLILIHFVYNWKIERSKKNTEIIRENPFEQKKKILWLKFNRRLALISWVFEGLKKSVVQ